RYGGRLVRSEVPRSVLRGCRSLPPVLVLWRKRSKKCPTPAGVPGALHQNNRPRPHALGIQDPRGPRQSLPANLDGLLHTRRVPPFLKNEKGKAPPSLRRRQAAAQRKRARPFRRG